MPEDKSERLVIRITASLKKSIEEMAEKQKITASELVRKVLEDAVCKKEKEIEECVLMVNTITKYINNILDQMVFTTVPKDISRFTSELREYKRLSYSHQLNAIEMILEVKKFNDTKTLSYKKILEDNIKAMNDFVEKSSKSLHDDKGLEIIQNTIDLLEDSVWNSTSKLYTHLCRKYFTN